MLTTLEKILLKIRFVMFLTHRLADLCLIHIKNLEITIYFLLFDKCSLEVLDAAIFVIFEHIETVIVNYNTKPTQICISFT